jgi:tRNA(fMet)-specific endonuclease VapC
MNYVFDTNILLFIIKKHPSIARLENEINESDLRIISIVTKGEIDSLALQRQWGEEKRKKLELLLNQFLIVPIDSKQIVNSYCEIDAYSQGKHPIKRPPSGFSSRNMGKNDLWIAATAEVTHSTLVTADGDFDHLDGVFFPLIKLKA